MSAIDTSFSECLDYNTGLEDSYFEEKKDYNIGLEESLFGPYEKSPRTKFVEFNSIDSRDDDTLYRVVENDHSVSDNSVILDDVTNQDSTFGELKTFSDGETSSQTETPEATQNLSLLTHKHESTFDMGVQESCSINLDHSVLSESCLGEDAPNFNVEPDLIKEYRLGEIRINSPDRWIKHNQQQELSGQQESLLRKRKLLPENPSPGKQYAVAREKEVHSKPENIYSLQQNEIPHTNGRLQKQSNKTQGEQAILHKQPIESPRQQDKLHNPQYKTAEQQDISPEESDTESQQQHESTKQRYKSPEKHAAMTGQQSELVQHPADSYSRKQNVSRDHLDDSASEQRDHSQTPEDQSASYYNDAQTYSIKTRRSTLSCCDPNSYSGTPTSVENIFSNGDHDDATVASECKSQEVEEAETENKNLEVEKTEHKTREFGDTAINSDEVGDTESKSREVQETEHTSRVFEETESKSHEVEDTDSKSRDVEETEVNSREVEQIENKSRAVDDTESKTREVKDTESQRQKAEDTTTVTTRLELKPVSLRGILTNGLKNTEHQTFLTLKQKLLEQQNKGNYQLDSTFNKCIRSHDSLFDGSREDPNDIGDQKGYDKLDQTNVSKHIHYQTKEREMSEYPTSEYQTTEYQHTEHPTTDYSFPTTECPDTEIDNADRYYNFSQVNATQQFGQDSPSHLLQNEYDTPTYEQKCIRQQYDQDANEIQTSRRQWEQQDESHITTNGHSGFNSDMFSAIPSSHTLNTSADLHQAMEHVRVMERRRTWRNEAHGGKRKPMYPNQFVIGPKDSRVKYLHMMGRLRRHSFEAWDKQYGPYRRHYGTHHMEGNKSESHIGYCMTGHVKSLKRNNDLPSCKCSTCVSTAQWVQGMAGVDVRLPQLGLRA